MGRNSEFNDGGWDDTRWDGFPGRGLNIAVRVVLDEF
jgi:hypothetical protein